MPWAKFDDQFHRRRKVRRLSDGAWRLYTSAIIDCCAEQSDGVIEGDVLRELLPKHAEKYINELLKAGLLHKKPGCPSKDCYAHLDAELPEWMTDPEESNLYVIHDFAEWQMTRAEWNNRVDMKVYAAHVRWHLEEPNDKCVHCRNSCTPDARCNAGACSRAMPT